MTTIDRFTKQTGYDFLSNFYMSTVSFEGQLYPSVEHAYQASKSTDQSVREIIRKAKTADEAKKLGQGIKVREDWLDIRLNIMKSLIKEKFSNPFLTHRLLATGDSTLVLNNKWNDKFWGVCRGEGENWLGKILMATREELKQESLETFNIHPLKVY